jgi:chromosome segregation ATPase
MIEMAMYFGVGFLAACLIMLLVANAVWRRAVRLTTKRVQASLPTSLADIRADRDQLRAEFALSTRRLEVSVDELRKRSYAQIADIGRKNEQIRVLLNQAQGRAEMVRSLEASEKTAREELLKAEVAHGDTLRALRAAETRLEEAGKNLAERERAIAEMQGSADTRRVEIAALQTNVARLEDLVSESQRALATAEEERTQRQVKLATVERELSDARWRITALQTELSAAEGSAQRQAEEIGGLQARIAEMAGQIQGHVTEAQRMGERIRELSAERDRLAEELTRRTAEAETRSKSLLEELEGTRAARADLEGRLAAVHAERERVTGELKRLEGLATENWDRERVENALLRERLNDLAAEITHMTLKLDGEDKTLDTLIARAEHEVRPSLTAAASQVGAKADDPRRRSLAERLRALQTRATAR